MTLRKLLIVIEKHVGYTSNSQRKLKDRTMNQLDFEITKVFIDYAQKSPRTRVQGPRSVVAFHKVPHICKIGGPGLLSNADVILGNSQWST
jgi:hypothetical protein